MIDVENNHINQIQDGILRLPNLLGIITDNLLDKVPTEFERVIRTSQHFTYDCESHEYKL